MGEGAHCVEYMVQIESWVDKQRGLEDHIPNITTRIKFRGCTGKRQETLRWVGDVLRHVIFIITPCRDGVYLRKEGLTVHDQ